jgi:hypothetical protein
MFVVGVGAFAVDIYWFGVSFLAAVPFDDLSACDGRL